MSVVISRDRTGAHHMNFADGPDQASFDAAFRAFMLAWVVLETVAYTMGALRVVEDITWEWVDLAK